MGVDLTREPNDYPATYVLRTEMLEKGAAELYRDSYKYPETTVAAEMREHLTKYLKGFLPFN